MNRLILLRHGITQANLERRYCGSSDLPLAETPLADFLAHREQLQYPDPTGLQVLTSGMLRTEQTLQAIYGDIPHTAAPAFREIDFGVFENHTYNELKDRPDYQQWLTGDNEQNICPGGESGVQMTTRVLNGFSCLTQDTLLISHGGVIAAIMAHLFPAEERSRYQWQPKPYEGYEILFSGGNCTWSPLPILKQEARQ